MAAPDPHPKELPEAPGQTALLIIDLINDLEFEGAEPLHQAARAAAERVIALRDQADAAGVPVVYVNDNYGHWHSDREEIIRFCAREGSHGRELVDRIKPRPDDLFVIKPQFSGFYATTLSVLLPRMKVSRLVLTGVAADICVLFTAADAHMREYRLWVPGDTVASESEQRTRWALEIMKNSMGAETRPTDEISLEAWLDESGQASSPRG